MLMWSTAAPAVGAAFLASAVEVVEAFTIVLAVATLRGWRPAALGAGAGFAVLAAIVVLIGPLLGGVPIAGLQLTIGVLLLLFGMGWLRKASLRAAGLIPLHDEDAIFAAETERLGGAARRRRGLDWIAGLTAFKAVVLEGIEVVFIVIAIGAGRGLLLPASVGALAACALVLLVGAAVHRPLSRVPENTLKFGVGVMLSAFGTFWIGEGLGVGWPGQDDAVAACRGIPGRRAGRRGSGATCGCGGFAMTMLRELGAELTGMFVGDARLAAALLAIVAAAALASAVLGAGSVVAGLLLAVGCPLLLIENVVRTGRRGR